MADNTTINAGTGGDVIATDDLTTLNGGAVSGVKAQRVKVGYGPDASLTDVSLTNGLPVHSEDSVVTGTISVTDLVVAAPAGDGTLRSGASTATSLVALACPGGDSSWQAQITGLTSGTLYFEGSLDSTNGTDGNWINVNGRRTGIVTTQLSGNTTANGVFRGSTAGFKYLRVRSVGTLVGTPAVILRTSSGAGAVFLNASIPEPVRTNVVLGFDATIGIAAEAVASISGVRGNTAVGAATTQAVTVGKTLRVMSFRAVVMAGGTAVINAKVRLRANYAGAAVLASPMYAELRPGIMTATAVANEVSPDEAMFFPDGLDFPSGSQIAISHVMTGTVTATQVSGMVIGYEY